MKRKLPFLVCLLALSLLVSQCKKSDSTHCATCSLSCVTGTVTNGYMCGNNVTSSTFCGSSQAISNWELGYSTQYSYSGGYCVNYTTAAPQTKQVCGADSSKAIATYTTAGYNCN